MNWVGLMSDEVYKNGYDPVMTKDYDEVEEISPHIKNNNNNNNDSLNHQQLLLKRQDTSLDILEQTVARLGALSLNISNEINEQNQMLNKLELEVEQAETKTTGIIAKTNEFLNKIGERSQCWIIIVLVLLLAFVVLLIIYS
eukprot:gene4997-6982_t